MKDYVNESKEYQNNLFDRDIGKPAREYLKSRQITPTTAKAWQLGYSPENFIPKCYEKYSNVKFKFWEKMNGRITIPVYNSNNELIAISGRAISKETKPKYMHYSFPTKKTLFGLNMNEKDIIKNNAIIFNEGQLDVISAWQHGLKICACTFGSHFSSEHFALASRYTNRINILYDNDEAGMTGVKNSLEKIKVRGDIKVKILKNILKNGEDLDNWIQKNDYNFILKVINTTQLDYLQYNLNNIK